jgi:cytochrome c biogenesis protein ResB
MFGKRGYVEFEEGERIFEIQDVSGEILKLPFEVELEDFHLEYYQEPDSDYKGKLIIYDDNGEFQQELEVNENKTFSIPEKKSQITIKRIIPDFVMDNGEITSRSSQFNNPALLIEAGNDKGENDHQWLFAKHPDFHGKKISAILPLMLYVYEQDIKDFVSVVSVYENNKKIRTAGISMNKPLKYKGWMFYQVSYDPNKPDWTKLEASGDPGVIFIYLGSFLLCLGVIMTFYINPLIRKRGRNND